MPEIQRKSAKCAAGRDRGRNSITCLNSRARSTENRDGTTINILGRTWLAAPAAILAGNKPPGAGSAGRGAGEPEGPRQEAAKVSVRSLPLAASSRRRAVPLARSAARTMATKAWQQTLPEALRRYRPADCPRQRIAPDPRSRSDSSADAPSARAGQTGEEAMPEGEVSKHGNHRHGLDWQVAECRPDDVDRLSDVKECVAHKDLLITSSPAAPRPRRRLLAL